MVMRTECILIFYSDFKLRIILIQLLLLSIVFSQYDIYDLNNYKSKVDTINHDATITMLKSFILPGWGQFSNGDPAWKPIMFLGIEIFAIQSFFLYNQRSNDLKNDFENFADDHWELRRWYDNTKIIFPDRWRDIIIGTHKLGLKIDGKYYYSDNLDELSKLHPWSDIKVVRDRDFYENIGKYDQFVGGWDDSYDDPFDSKGNWFSQKKGNVESVILTKRKNYYRNLRYDSNRYSNYAKIATSAVLANHIISSIETILWPKNKGSNIKVKLKLKPYSFVNEDGVQFILSW